MNILFNDLARFRERSGVGGYVQEIWERLPPNIMALSTTFYGRPVAKAMARALGNSMAAGRSNALTAYLKKHGHRTLEQYLAMSVKLSRPNLYHEPDLLPLFPSDHTVVTAHDLSVLKFPHWHPEHRLRHYDRHVHFLSKRVGRFIADSQQTKNDLMELLGIETERIDIVHLAPRTSITQTLELATHNHLKLPEHFLLYTGTIEPRKNIAGILDAYSLLSDRLKNQYALVLVGARGWNTSNLLNRIQDTKGVRYLGYLPDQELAECLGRANAFIYPSFFEGFGLPPLEAMAAGIPVVASNRGSLKEILGDAAAFIEPEDPNDIARKIEQVLIDPYYTQSLVVSGKKQVANFSWEKTLRLTIDSYQKLMGLLVEAPEPPKPITQKQEVRKPDSQPWQ